MNTSSSATTARRFVMNPNTSPASIAYEGYHVLAPGFSATGFARMVERAFGEGVQLQATDQPGQFHATRPGSPSSYTTSRASCSCWAGSRGNPCKHRALACLILVLSRPRAP